MSTDLRQQLADEIRSVFRDAQYRVEDDVEGAFAFDEVEPFEGKHWSEVSPDLILSRWYMLTAFTPLSFCFFLPAFLLVAVLESGGLAINIMSALSPGERLVSDPTLDKWLDEWRSEIANCLSLRQKQVVLKFFSSYRELYLGGSWTFIEKEQRQIDAGIEFWAKQIQEASE